MIFPHTAATSDMSPTQRDAPALFASLPPAYFTPSSPAHLTHLFLLHGGQILPPLHSSPSLSPSESSSIQPLTLPVEYYFVVLNDPLIPHLSRRPIVLFDAGWVGECVRRGERVSLGDWIVEGDPYGEMKYLTSPSIGKSDGIISTRRSDGIISTQTSSEDSLPYIQTPLTPTQALSSRPQIVAPRLLLDFERNTTLDLLSGETSHTLGAYDRSAHSSRNKKRKAPHQHYSSEPPRPFRPNPLSPPLGGGIETSPDLAISSSFHTPTPRRTVNSRPPRYVLEEVMVLLRKANRAMGGVEVVGGPRWRVDEIGREDDEPREAY